MSSTSVEPATGRRVRAGDPLHAEVVEFLGDEASLLDDNRLLEWVALMAPDVAYRMPVRVTRMRDDTSSDFSDGMYHFDETVTTLMVKASRLATTASPWAENPRSRTRRFITNVKVHITDTEEVTATSSLLLVRSRYDEAHLGLLTAERRDVLRRVADGFQIARRTIYVDQSSLGLSNLAIFL